MKTRNLALILILLVVLVAVGTATSLYVQAGRVITDFEESKPLPGAVLYDQNGEVIKRLGTGSVYVPLDKTPRDLQNAMKATQDKGFYKEQGWEKLGARTINERVARQILEPKGMWARLQLALLPSILQRRYSERERLEMYLNQTYFGEGAVGVEAASQRYFAKPVAELDLAQSALLAALAQEPEQASPYSKPSRAKALRDAVLVQMQKDGHIDKAKHEQATKSALDLKRHEPGYAHHFSDYLSQMLVEKLGEERVYQGGLKVTTTLDHQLQKLAENIFAEREVEGALVALDSKDGKILAMVGGLNYLENKTNLAVADQKQVATTLRPLIYATGLKEEWAMNHLVEDVQKKFGDLDVKNAGDRYWGPVTMKHALVMDLNNAAIWTLNKLGLEKFTNFAQSVDLKLDSADQNLRLAMGDLEKGLSLLHLTAAYLPAARGGVYLPVVGFEQVRDTDNKEVLKAQTDAPKRILSEEQAYLLTDMLMAGTEYGSIRQLDVDFPAALTASSSQDKSSEWAIGYTPTLVVGVYVKSPQTKDEEKRAELLAGEIWVEFMTNAQKEDEPSEFTVPEDVETDILIDVFTGLLGSTRCPQVELDAFIKGTKPTQMAPCAIPPPPVVPSIPEPQAPPVVPPVVPPVPPQEETPPKEPIVPEPEPEPAPPEVAPPVPEEPIQPVPPQP